MPRIVMKFGGTSMAGIERIRHVAERVKREVQHPYTIRANMTLSSPAASRLRRGFWP